MGDRANIIIEKDDLCFPAPVFFYGHWIGSELKSVLQTALERGRTRWDDPAYLARIIFNQMTKGVEMEQIGFGISTSIGDGDHNCLFVNMAKKSIRAGSYPSEGDGQWTFEEFVALDLDAEDETEE